MIESDRPTIPQLFASFLQLGVTAFGGPSMVAYIRRMAVEKKHWLDAEIFNDGVALCQMIPGATAMQSAGYVGLKTRGVLGAAASFVGFGLPAFFLMMVFAALYAHAQTLPAVVSAFSGLQAIIVAIIVNATLSFGRTTFRGWEHFVIAGLAATLFSFSLNPILVIFLAAIAGWALVRPKQSVSANAAPHARGPRASTYKKQLALLFSVSAVGLLLLFFFNQTLFNLAFVMLRIDLFAFGGGFASVPLMLHEVVQVRHWMDSHTFMDGIVLGQVTPGPIVITATFVGYLLGGPFGGVVATLSIFLPSFAVLISVAPYFDRLRTSPFFNKIISGVLCSFVGLLFTVAVRFGSKVHWDWPHFLLASGALIALLVRLDILWVVLIGTIISVVVFR